MPERYSVEQIRQYWTDQAEQYGQSHAASWSDRYAIDLEIKEVLKWLQDGDSILDIGCANGYSTLAFAAQKNVKIRGADYIPEMIAEANNHLGAVRGNLKGDVSFYVGDILDIKEPDASFDKVVVIRVVINLANWEAQVKAVKECARVLAPGGLLLMSEATMQGWNMLNRFRAEWQLSEIPMPPFNLYLDQDKVVAAAEDELELVGIENFSSTYFVATRILKPLLARDSNVDVANPEMEWNRWASLLPAAGDYGTQKLFVFRKK